MGRECKTGEPICRDLILVHITLHQKRGLCSRSHALHSFEICIASGGEGRVHAGADFIGELFHASDQRDIHHAARDGEITLTQRRATRGARGFDGRSLDAKQTRVVRE